MSCLKAGSVVYRVIEVDPPSDVRDLYTWKAAAAVIAKASAKQVKLKTPFPGLARTLFTPSALGRSFFETPLQAIQFFLIERRPRNRVARSPPPGGRARNCMGGEPERHEARGMSCQHQPRTYPGPQGGNHDVGT